MRDLGNAFNVGNVQFGIADGLRVNRFCFRRDSFLKSVKIIRFDEPDMNPQTGECVMKQVISSPVEIVRGYDFISRPGDVEKRKSYGRLAACHRKGSHAAV